MTNLFDQIFGPGLLIAICDECHQARMFRSERERDLWDRNHTHQEDPA